jgi:GGDEF domain-containing protein
VSQALTQEVVLSSGVVTLSASIGGACSGEPENGDELVARADVAMYESKREG